jgi:hypothetical protein
MNGQQKRSDMLVLQSSNIQSIIRNKMGSDRKRQKQKKCWQRAPIHDNARPILSQKSQFRFQQFKESVRKECQANEEYMFNEDFKNNLNNFSVKDKKGTQLNDLIQFQDFTVSQLNKTKQVMNKLNEQMGIELTASHEFGLSKAC